MVYVLTTGTGEAALAFAMPTPNRRAAGLLGPRAANDCRREMSAVDGGDPQLDSREPASLDGQDRAQVELLARVVVGERGALAALYEQHGSPVFSYLMTLCNDRGLAEEVLQDTFMAVWRGAATFEGRSRVRTWLLAIARRQALARLRRRGEEFTDLDELLTVPAPGLTPEEQALAGAALERLASAIGQLGPLQREIVVLAFVQQLSYVEMAELLAVPVGTVRSRLAGARRQLAKLVNEAESGQ